MPWLLGEDNTKKYEESPFINKFSVEYHKDLNNTEMIEKELKELGVKNVIDYLEFETISRAREMDIKYDGGIYEPPINEYYYFNLYDTLEEALNHHRKRIDKVTFKNLTEEEMKIVEAYKEEKMNDDTYLAKFGISKKNDEETKEDDDLEM